MAFKTGKNIYKKKIKIKKKINNHVVHEALNIWFYSGYKILSYIVIAICYFLFDQILHSGRGRGMGIVFYENSYVVLTKYYF